MIAGSMEDHAEAVLDWQSFTKFGTPSVKQKLCEMLQT
jgi:hypothetical protein